MKKSLSICLAFVAGVTRAVTTGVVPTDGVFKFTFGTEYAAAGFAVPTSAVYDATKKYANTTGETFTYGFLGTTDESYKNDVPWSLPKVARAIDGFSVVQGQVIRLRDVAGKGVAGPLKGDYLPAGASAYEGRYPIRFSMSAEPEAYYAVTCTVANVSATEPADVTLFSERCHIQAHHLTLAPNEMRTFAWSVELWPNFFKTAGSYVDDAINVVLVGENAALKSLTVVKEPQVAGTVRGVATDKMNVGRTMWLCDDSTGTDQSCAVPYFSLQNYSGVGSGLSRYAPSNVSIRNQGEGGLATNANTHRKSCQLKPGDYLYVEFGHNESSTASYTKNLELYFADANAAGANLIIVSPLERRSSWDAKTATWNRTLKSYGDAGAAWVEAKIAAGAKNVAFLDLNKRYNDWMNAELQRIHAVNPSVSLNAAISYYYRSAKGAHVDNTHINNAGTDQAAYCVWQEILARVAAGETESATDSEKIQSAVLKGLADGYQATIGDSDEPNRPWSVTDDIIKAGSAPNVFWDTPVTAGFKYVNDAVVAAVDATANDDGLVTLKGVTMRILNPNNYYKAVVEVTDAAGVKTRYYSYYNYDVGGAGKLSGDLVDPEPPGFLTGDKDKADVSAADLPAVTIPAKGKAEIWIAEADAGTWQVGMNSPCSAKLPLEWWSKTIVEEPCEDEGNWTVLTQAVNEKAIVDGALSIMSTGADASNTKKNMGIYRALDADVASGRYRISFKAKIEAGTVNFLLGDAINTTTTLFKNSVVLMTLTGTAVTGYQNLVPEVTIGEDGKPQARVNTSRWVDFDLIVDRDNARAALSVGGSDYVEWSDPEFIPGSFAGLPWKYFGLTTPGQMSTYGAIDEVKIVKLAPVKVESDKYVMTTWDDFTDGNGLGFVRTSDDEVTSAGLVWKNSANKGTAGTLTYGKYITFTPTANGLFVLKFSVDSIVARREPTLIVSEAETTADCTTANKLASVVTASAQTEYILRAELEAGKTYIIWPYSYNWTGAKYEHNYTISSVAYITEKKAAVKVPLFITGGQSNTDGRLNGVSAGQELPSYLAGGNPNARVTRGGGTFTAFAPATGTAGQPDKWAYDAVTYYHLAQALGTIYVAKTSYGGTSIDPRVNNSPSTHANAWLPQYGGGYHWSADPTFLAATSASGTPFEQDGVTYDGQSLLKTWIATIDAAIDALIADGKEPDIKAILWHQGESDRTVAGDYQANLLAMVTYVRNHLVEKTGKTEYANLPFFCGTIPFASTQGNTTLDKAFLALDADRENNIYAVDIHDITLKSDNIHFSTQGAEIFGRRLYNRLVDEGVVDGEKVDEPYAVRKPDFGLEHIVNNTTTWTFNGMSGTGSAEAQDVNGLYLHSQVGQTSRSFQFLNSSPKGLSFTIGDTSQLSIAQVAYTAGFAYGDRITAVTSAGNTSTDFRTMAAVNVGRAGTMEFIVYATSKNEGGSFNLYFNGTKFEDCAVVNTTASTYYNLKGENSEPGTYYLAAGGYFQIVAARFVPTEEMEQVTVTIPESGVTIFGNIYGCSFALQDGLAAYAVGLDPTDSTKVVLSPVATINVDAAVIVIGAAGNYPLAASEGVVVAGDNLLAVQKTTGPVEAIAGEDFANFLVGVNGGTLTFTKSDETTVVPAGSAYLSVPTGVSQAKETVLTATLPRKSLVYAVDADGEEKIADSISGAVAIQKIGTGTLTLSTINAFSGSLSVLEGEVRLASYRDVEGVRFDFDFGDKSTYEEKINFVESYATGSDAKPYTFTGVIPEVTNDVAILNGRTALACTKMLMKTSGTVLPKDSVGTTFAVAQYLTSTKSGKFIGDWSDAYYGMRWYWAVSGNKMNWHPNTTSSINGRINGVEDGTVVAMTPFVFATRNKIARVENSARALSFGGSAAMAWGEVVNFSRILSESEFAFVEACLMDKWGIASATILPEDSEVSVAAGATLNLGPYHPTVKAVTLAKGAVISVAEAKPGDTLLTAQTIVNEGAILTIGGYRTNLLLGVARNADGSLSLRVFNSGFCVIVA